MSLMLDRERVQHTSTLMEIIHAHVGLAAGLSFRSLRQLLTAVPAAVASALQRQPAKLKEDDEVFESRRKYLQHLDRFLHTGMVFHLNRKNGAGSLNVACCSKSSHRVLGIPEEELVGNFEAQLASKIGEASHREEFHDQFRALVKLGHCMDWTGKLAPSSTFPEGQWIRILTAAPQQCGDEAAGEAPRVGACFGFAYIFSEEQQAQQLKAEQCMHASDNRLFHYAKNCLGSIAALREMMQQQSLPWVERDGDVAELLDVLAAACSQGEADCHLRLDLDHIFDGTYELQESLMNCGEVLQHYAKAYNVRASPFVQEGCSTLMMSFDRKLLNLVVNNLVSNARKYGCGKTKPNIRMKLSADDLLILEVWNAPGPKHELFMQRSTAIMQSVRACDQRWLSTGLGLKSIAKCLACAGWKLSHTVGSEGTLFQIIMADALMTPSGQKLSCQHDEGSDQHLPRRLDQVRHHDATTVEPKLGESTVVPNGPISAVKLLGETKAEKAAAKGPTADASQGPVPQMFPVRAKVAVLDDGSMMRLLYKKSLGAMRVEQFWVRGATPEEIFSFPQFVMDQEADLVILDQNLSEVIPTEEHATMYGTVILQQLISIGYTGICVTRTAYESSGDAKAGYLKCGFDAVLSKQGALQAQLAETWHTMDCGSLLHFRRTPVMSTISLKFATATRPISTTYPLLELLKPAGEPHKMPAGQPSHMWERRYWQLALQQNRATIPRTLVMHMVFLTLLALSLEDKHANLGAAFVNAALVGILAACPRVSDWQIRAVSLVQMNIMYPASFAFAVGLPSDSLLGLPSFYSIMLIGVVGNAHLMTMVGWMEKVLWALVPWLVALMVMRQQYGLAEVLHDTDLVVEMAVMVAASVLIGAGVGYSAEKANRALFVSNQQRQQNVRHLITTQKNVTGRQQATQMSADDKVTQLPLSLHFLDSSCEDRFRTYLLEEVNPQQLGWGLVYMAVVMGACLVMGVPPKSIGIGYRGGVTLAVLHAAAGAGTLMGGLSKPQLSQIWTWLMWLSQGTIVMQYAQETLTMTPLLIIIVQSLQQCQCLGDHLRWYQRNAPCSAALLAHAGSAYTNYAAGLHMEGQQSVSAPTEYQTWVLTFALFTCFVVMWGMASYGMEKRRRHAFLYSDSFTNHHRQTDARVDGDSELKMHGWELHFEYCSWERRYWQLALQQNRAAIPRNRILQMLLLVFVHGFMGDTVYDMATGPSFVSAALVGILAACPRVSDWQIRAVSLVQMNIMYPASFAFAVGLPSNSLLGLPSFYSIMLIGVVGNAHLMTMVGWMEKVLWALVPWLVALMVMRQQYGLAEVLHDTDLVVEMAVMVAASVLIGAGVGYSAEKANRALFVSNQQRQQNVRHLITTQKNVTGRQQATQMSADDKVTQLPLSLHFLDSSCEDRFRTYLLEEVNPQQLGWGLVYMAVVMGACLVMGVPPKSIGIGYRGGVTLAVLHAAAGAGTLMGGLSKPQLSQIWTWLMWLSQGTIVMQYAQETLTMTPLLIIIVQSLQQCQCLGDHLRWYHKNAPCSAALLAHAGSAYTNYAAGLHMEGQQSVSAPTEYQTWGITLSMSVALVVLWVMASYGMEKRRRHAFLHSDSFTNHHRAADARVDGDSELKMHGWELHFEYCSWERRYWQLALQQNRAAIPRTRVVHILWLALVALCFGDTAYHFFTAPAFLSAALVVILAACPRVPDRLLRAVSLVQMYIVYPACLTSSLGLPPSSLHPMMLSKIFFTVSFLMPIGSAHIMTMVGWLEKVLWTLVQWFVILVVQLQQWGLEEVFQDIVLVVEMAVMMVVSVLIAARVGYVAEKYNRLHFGRQMLENMSRDLFLFDAQAVVPGVMFRLRLEVGASAEVDLQFTYVSSFSQHLLGLDPDDMCANFATFASMLQDVETLREVCAASAPSVSSINWTGKLKAPKSSWIHLVASAEVGSANSGQGALVIEYTGLITDCTESSQLHLEKLRKSDSHLFHATKNNFAVIQSVASSIQQHLESKREKECHQGDCSTSSAIQLARNIRLEALIGECDCHSHGILNQLLEGSYQRSLSQISDVAPALELLVESYGFTFVLEDIQAANNAMLDIHMFKVVVVSLFSDLIQNMVQSAVVRLEMSHNAVTVKVSQTFGTVESFHSFVCNRFQHVTSEVDTELSPNGFTSRLHISKQCLQSMGGQVGCNVDKANKTAEYILSVPYATSICSNDSLTHDSSSAKAECSAVQLGIADAVQPWVKVAALDDEKLCRMILSRQLKHLQFPSICVQGETRKEIVEFPDMVMQNNISLVILDIWLGRVIEDPDEWDEFNGISIMKSLRQKGFTGMCIARTADSDIKGKLLDVGFDAVIDKTNSSRIVSEWQNYLAKREPLEANPHS
ncbi:hypothetical protein CYMTET_40855 [Cymbomonas tetramitiformis]|uniref:Uncharacterized protein n=1 Tax=Cymbomonas tetramitiformis TaxID=36881 RepID=A0AAE0C9F1_9CHLO|nr:hypothetical protein CYMTET_40855 [Cymbomonas tetramitiformis]